MRQHIIGVVMFIALNGALTSAQEPADMLLLGQGPPQLPLTLPVPPPDFKVGMLAIEPFEMGEAVEHAPYSAEIVNEVTQQLADGNRIERRMTGTVARDSRGRVRREHQLAAIGPVVPDGDVRMVTISDPVARVHYALDPVRKVAMRSPAPKVVRGPMPAAKGSLMISGGGVPEAGLGVNFQVRHEPDSPDVQTEQLGTKEYEGVRAEGTRTVATLPAGAIGNVRPIEIITRAEPDASLFEVPADYKREDVKPLPFELPARQW
jgi:hypothetical protein